MLSIVSPVYCRNMKVLLSDGSGITSRQLATVLTQQRHEVHVACPPGITLSKFTKHVKRNHIVPPFGLDPYRWLDSVLDILRKWHFDVLVPAQEQVAVLSAQQRRVLDMGVKVAVPPFDALNCVMDKVAACRTLGSLGLSQPVTVIVQNREELLACSNMLPVYIKTPIGTASRGVQRVVSFNTLNMMARQHEEKGSFNLGGRLVVQKSVHGPVLMISSVFCQGTLISWHACLKIKDGPSGGAAQKESLPLAFVGHDLSRIGKELGWHGALSMDAIFVVAEQKVYYIDVNPRIVEPINALHAGVNLVGDLLLVSLATEPWSPPPQHEPKVGRVNQRTHQILLALLKAAGRGRLYVLGEAFNAFLGFGAYKNSQEELTPLGNDWISMGFISIMTILLAIFGERLAKYLDKGNSASYALSQSGWNTIKRQQQLTKT